MIEINSTVLVLLVEYLVAASVVVVLILVLARRRKKKKQSAVAQLVSQIKKQSEIRTQETGSFLKEIYQLEEDDLKKAVKAIDKSEKQLFRKLIDSYLTDDPDIITSMDAAVAELVDTYKDLKPKVQQVEVMPEAEHEALLQQIRDLEESNERANSELSITKTTMGNMIAEFGNMFGGGADHELASFEVVEKVSTQQEDDEEKGEVKISSD